MRRGLSARLILNRDSDLDRTGVGFRDQGTEMCSGSEAGSYLRLIDSCITPLKAQGPSKTCIESKQEEEEVEGLGVLVWTFAFPTIGMRISRMQTPFGLKLFREMKMARGFFVDGSAVCGVQVSGFRVVIDSGWGTTKTRFRVKSLGFRV